MNCTPAVVSPEPSYQKMTRSDCSRATARDRPYYTHPSYPRHAAHRAISGIVGAIPCGRPGGEDTLHDSSN